MSDTVTGAVHTADELGRFNHHPDPVIDFEIEIEEIESILIDCEYGLRDWRAERLDERSSKAFGFISVSAEGQKAKVALRELYPRLRAVISPHAVSAAEGDLLGLALEALRKAKAILSDHIQIAKNLNDEAGEDAAATLAEEIDAILSEQAREVTR